MVMQVLNDNAADLAREIQWLQEVIYVSFKLYFKNPCPYNSIYELTPPDHTASQSQFATAIKRYGLDFDERVVLILAIVPHIDSKVLDIFFCKNPNTDRSYSEFGGLKGNNHSGFLPTGETVSFILAGDSLQKKISLLNLFSPDHPFGRNQVLYLDEPAPGEPLWSGALKIEDEFFDSVTLGGIRKPRFNAGFPAIRIETKLGWDDVVLNPTTKMQVTEILGWIDHGTTLMQDWGMQKKFRPGYRCLFYGPPGTGKTMTACLLGQASNREVYKVDLSMVISKWVGETEKNLARVFDRAQNKDWILFFDEADALFGKRTDISSSHDRYANQEVAYLLQRIELFDGIVILATNLKDNLDEAFTRRFESLVYFPQPKAAERKLIWEKAFSEKATLAPDVDMDKLSEQFNLTGATIMNVVRYASLQAIARNSQIIQQQDLMQGIRKEYAKDGKTL
jgi:hypothetical protein